MMLTLFKQMKNIKTSWAWVSMTENDNNGSNNNNNKKTTGATVTVTSDSKTSAQKNQVRVSGFRNKLNKLHFRGAR